MSSISADSYPSRASNQANSGSADSGGGGVSGLAHPLAETSETTPDRPTVSGADLHFDPAAPRPNSSVGHEVHGPVGAPQTTLRHDSAAPGQEGFPAGWQQASPSQTVAGA